MIRFDSVSFSYDPDRPLFRTLDLDIGPGLTLVVGPNGSGKSTLLKLAAGVEPPDSGRVFVDGKDLWMEEAAARRDLAYVPEQADLTPYATIREILALVARLRGEPRGAVEESLAAAGLGGLGQRSIRELSLGQRRRATLAAAFVGRPRLLLLDEPLEALDRAMRQSVLAWLQGRLDGGAAAVVVSHDLAPFAALAARILALREGWAPLVEDPPADHSARAALLEELSRP